MKKFFVSVAIVFVFVVAFAVFTITVNAQTGETGEVNLYTVQEGDTLWVLEGEFSGRPAQWSRLLELNPFLRGPGRVWVDNGRTIVLIRPGEKLRGLVELGIIPKLYPLSQLKVAAPPTPTIEKNGGPWWIWLLLIVLALVAILGLVWIVARAIMTRDPITAGPAMVPGGVTDQTVEQAFRHGSTNPHIRIDNIVRGRISGGVRVRYRDGSSRLLKLNNEVGYRAMVSRDGRVWGREYMLQGCGNDIRHSGLQYIPGLKFSFVPEEPVVMAQSPTPTAATAPNPSPQSATPASEEKEFTFRPATDGPNARPNFIDSKGFESFEVNMKDGRTTIRFS